MFKRTITYSDYNGVERTEDFYFNLTQAELMEMELSTAGTFTAMVQGIINAKDAPSIAKIFKELLFKAYGQKSPDGRRFVKSEELSKEFSETPAYSQLYMELATNDDKAAEFVNGIMPAELAAQAVDNAGPRLLPSAQTIDNVAPQAPSPAQE